MPEIEVRLRDRYGLHPRAALRIQQAVAGRRAKVTIRSAVGDGRAADAGSLIALVSAGIGFDEPVLVDAAGEDAEGVLATLRDLLQSGICHP